MLKIREKNSQHDELFSLFVFCKFAIEQIEFATANYRIRYFRIRHRGQFRKVFHIYTVYSYSVDTVMQFIQL